MQIFTIKNRSKIEYLTFKSHDDTCVTMAKKFNDYHFRELTKLITIDNHFEHLRNGHTIFYC